MKTAVFLSLLAIGYLIYWNWRRVVQRYKPITARAAEHVRIEGLMKSFGESRKQLAVIKETYASRFGRAADLDSGWPQVTRSVELASANLSNFNFDLAAHFMAEAVRFATDVLKRKAHEQGVLPDPDVTPVVDTADGDMDGLEETRQCVQDALNRRG